MQELVYTNSNGGTVTVSLPPYMLLESDLGNPSVQFVKVKAPGQDGETIEDTPLDGRQISFTIRIIGDSVEDLYSKRRALHSIFNPKLDGNLIYTNDVGTMTIPCRPTGIPQTKDREGVSQQMLIQLFCPSPYWQDEAETVEYLATWIGDLQFPTSFPAEGFEFGHRAQSLIVNAANPGDVPCGLRVELSADATVVNPYLLNIYTSEIIRVKKTLTAGEKIVIDTTFGNESVILMQGRSETDVFNWLDAPDAADFMQLALGDNYLRYGATSGMDNLEMAIFYTPKYTGA